VSIGKGMLKEKVMDQAGEKQGLAVLMYSKNEKCLL